MLLILRQITYQCASLLQTWSKPSDASQSKMVYKFQEMLDVNSFQVDFIFDRHWRQKFADNVVPTVVPKQNTNP